MTKKECSELQANANAIIESVTKAIKSTTADKPLVLFNPKKINCDEIYDFPYGYTVGRHGDYLQGNVQKVCGNDVTLFLTGDDYGQTLELELEQLPFESLVQLLSYVEETL
jgi:hypothetical protein